MVDPYRQYLVAPGSECPLALLNGLQLLSLPIQVGYVLQIVTPGCG